jgi:hypothetical protein
MPNVAGLTYFRKTVRLPVNTIQVHLAVVDPLAIAAATAGTNRMTRVIHGR